MTNKPKRTKRKPAPKTKYYGGDVYTAMWSNIGGGGQGGAYDSFGALAAPGPIDLIGAFSDTVYSCTTLISAALSEIDIRLVAETRAGQAAPKSGFRIGTKHIRKRFRTKALELHEIADHPALDLLYRPNPETSYADLIAVTQSYLDIVGRAFWLVTDDSLGMPARLDILPAEQIRTVWDEHTGKLVGYKYTSTADSEPVDFPPDRVIAFRNSPHFDLSNREGISPLRAVWQKVQLLGPAWLTLPRFTARSGEKGLSRPYRGSIGQAGPSKCKGTLVLGHHRHPACTAVGDVVPEGQQHDHFSRGRQPDGQGISKPV